MECPHLNSNVCITIDTSSFPHGPPSSWCCSVCRSNKSPWVCLTCLNVHCGRYVNAHAKQHYEDSQVTGSGGQKRCEESEKNAQHLVCMDCSSYSLFCYRCDDFVVNDTKPGHVQKVRDHLRILEKSLVEELRKTLCYLWQGGPTAFSPDSLFYVVWKIMPSFRGYQQQDAHEFMRYLLDHLHRELQGAPALTVPPDHVKVSGDNPILAQDGLPLPQDEGTPPTTGGKCCINGSSTVVTSIFGGVLQNEVNCLICGTESRKFDPFLDLSLDIPSQFRHKRTKDQEPGPTCTLRDCLCSFTDLEELDQTELYMCHRCKKRQKSTKKFWVQKLPKVLCLHLKRFHWTSYLRNKVTTYVEFPLRGLDMRGYLLQPEEALPDRWLYDLVAVVVHHGSGVGSGHYTAYGKRDGRWYHFNDSTVTLAEEETVVKAKAYILFYTERPDKTTPETDARL